MDSEPGLDVEVQHARARVGPGGAGEVDDGDALHQAAGQLRLGRHPATVDDHDDVRALAARRHRSGDGW